MAKRSARPPVQHGRLRRRGVAGGVARFVATVIAVVAISSVSLAAIAVQQTVGGAKADVHLTHLNGSTAIPQVGAAKGAINILLAGTDTRTGQVGFQDKADLKGSSGAGNNDVTMVLHVYADHKHAVVLSIPRDLMTSIPACPRSGGGSYPAESTAQFNSSLSRGGLPCTVLTVEKITGLQIPYAALISFDGVIAMSDAVGGVTVCLASPAKDPYTGLDLPAGEQTLQGAQALAFVRSRHGVGDGSDLGRISAQQIFLSALMRKITSEGVLSNPVTLYTLANAAVKNMEFSDTLGSPVTMVSIASALKGIGLDNMTFVQYPTVSDPTNPNRVVAQQSAANVLTKALVNDQVIQLSGTLGRAAVAGSATPTTPATPAATGTASAAPTTAPSDDSSAVALPDTVTGQTANEQTCAKGVVSKG